MTQVISRGLRFFLPPPRPFAKIVEGKKPSLSGLFPVNDPFCETVNFRLEHEGVVYCGLISHAALHAHFGADETEDGPMNAFICHATAIAAVAASRLRTASSGLITIEADDL